MAKMVRDLDKPFLGVDTKFWANYTKIGSCQDYGPLLRPLNTRCLIVLRTQKGAIILTTDNHPNGFNSRFSSIIVCPGQVDSLVSGEPVGWVRGT